MKFTKIISAILLIASMLSLASCKSDLSFLNQEKNFTKDDFSITLTTAFSEPEDYMEYQDEEGYYNYILESYDILMYMFLEEFTLYADEATVRDSDYSLSSYVDYMFNVNLIDDEPKYHNGIPYYETIYEGETEADNLNSLTFFYRSDSAFYVTEFVYYANEPEHREKVLAYAESVTFTSETTADEGTTN